MLIETGRPRPGKRVASESIPAPTRSRRPARFVLSGVLLLMLGALEFQTSWFQSRLFTTWARRATFSVEPGGSDEYRHPHSGPYDIRLGHSLLTGFLERLAAEGFTVESQARPSREMALFMDWGLSPSYDEKPVAGLHISDRFGRPLYSSSYPERVYSSFSEIPPLVVDSLLFIENREALETDYPFKNPAVEWDRFANAAMSLAASKLGASHDLTGGSTLATQLEKIRHSTGGRTDSVAEKLRQMISASMRVYSGGRTTADARRRIVTEYLNGLPLAAIPGYGEVYGLGDGLWAWFDADFGDINRLLRNPGVADELHRTALAYRQVLSLLLAIKKPTAFLVRDRADLAARVDGYLVLLEREGLISNELRDTALRIGLRVRSRAEVPRAGSYSSRKATDSVRIELLRQLGVSSVYELDRLDLSVESTLDGSAQRSVTAFLSLLRDPEFARRAGLNQHRLLARGDPSGVIYSVSLYERGQGVNLLRVQADNLDQPLNVNQGTKLELGSTAKLRTLVSYLEAVSELHAELSPLSTEERSEIAVAAEDRLTRWAIAFLDAFPGAGLETIVEAAMTRRYRASPADSFFTGGGLHRFTNFDAKDNTRIVTVREAFRRSVNLAFVRLMRDLVNYRMYRMEGVSPDILTNASHPARLDYLSRFAAREGRQFLTRYYQKYQGRKTDQALHLLADSLKRKTPRALAAVHRLIRPDDGVNGFAAYLIGSTLNPRLSDDFLNALYDEYAPERFSLTDRAYIAGIDPLELWLVDFKVRQPTAGLGEVFREGGPYCQIAYGWLFKSRQRRAQDRAIRIMLEVDAFRELHRGWKRQGYPFRWLVPSLATALGSSGDTPAALADLVGIIANHGVYYPSLRINRLHFAQDTPFETNLTFPPQEGLRVIPEAVAAVLQTELVGVVEEGTGRRALGAILVGDGTSVEVGGKTGTGDNRRERYGPGGRVIESRVINRTATFVFLIGDKYFGAVTAYVPGEAAAAYGFTSSLPVQIFRELAPALTALMRNEEAGPLPLVAAYRSQIADAAEAPAPTSEPATPATSAVMPPASDLTSTASY